VAERGGYQPPARPAAVSGPGRLSARTDSRATQGAKDYKAEQHGDRKALREQQKAAPLAGRPRPDVNPTAPTPMAGPVDPFAPSQRPGEPPTAGIPFGPGPAGPTELQTALDRARALYAMHPSEALRDAIEELETLV
jgi:hypothetical protein